jgi:hypothetical protein
MRVARYGILYGVLLLTAACGEGTTAPQPTVTVTAPPASVASPTQPTPTPPPVTTPQAPSPPRQTGAAAAAVIPNVVGVNHQLAQDTMQAAGFYVLTEEDATGQGRLLVNDRNWVVVSQDPAAGTTVPLTTKILLKSKKIGE